MFISTQRCAELVIDATIFFLFAFFLLAFIEVFSLLCYKSQIRREFDDLEGTLALVFSLTTSMYPNFLCNYWHVNIFTYIDGNFDGYTS